MRLDMAFRENKTSPPFEHYIQYAPRTWTIRRTRTLYIYYVPKSRHNMMQNICYLIANGGTPALSALQPHIRRARVRAARGVVRRQGQDPARGAGAAAAAPRQRQAAPQRAHAVQGAARARPQVPVAHSSHHLTYSYYFYRWRDKILIVM